MSFGIGLTGAAGTEAAVSARPKDVTTASFRQDVIAESMRQPVLVDFWAPWCGPCKQLAPILERAVAASGGKVSLVKMNIDDHPDIAGQLGIQSIPAVIAFQRGQPVDGFVGALPESQIKQFLERVAGPLGDPVKEMLEEAATAAAEGDPEAAAALYAEILQADEANAPAIAGLAKLHLDAGDIVEAKAVLASASGSPAQDPAVVAVRAAIENAEQSANLGDLTDLQRKLDANPQDHQARFDYALALNARSKREEAAGELLDIIRADRSWNEDGARVQLLKFFDEWGFTDPASIVGRRKLSGLLFR